MTPLDDEDGGGGPASGGKAGTGDQSIGSDWKPDDAPAPDGKKGATLSDLADIPEVREYLNRVGATVRSIRKAVVKEHHGRYWRDLVTIELDKATGEIAVARGDGGDTTTSAPKEIEAKLIKAACAGVQWPEPLPLQPGRNGLPPLPDALKNMDRENLFAFHDAEGRVLMVQRRATAAELEEKAPKYTPWSHWDDGRWRCMEPEGLLPLWGTNQLKDGGTAFLHEGAKAARAVARMVAGETREDRQRLAAHPWGLELSEAAHLGWVGGALSPHRTDWSVLKQAGVTRVYIVSDNDEPGREAVPRIARNLRMPCFHLSFTDEFDTAFDLADDFPRRMFSAEGRYTGPAFHELLEPATWATDLYKPEGGSKPVSRLREYFANQWIYADEPELFVCKADTRIIRGAENLSKKLGKYSDSPGTSRLLLKACEHVTTLAYAPDKGAGTVTVRGQRAFNVYRPSGVKPHPGDVTPWTDFLGYLFPKAGERKEVERWCATLIARPHVRMHFGLLLASRTQGVGKGILATQVLAPLVGDHNVGFPSEHDIAESQFNDWMAHKRLVVVGEIYQGHSFKAYNRLKGVITDKDFAVNKKHQTSYRIDNWCHVLVCSNSDEALKMEGSDRRWLYPEVTAMPWGRDKFEEFVKWLAGGGLNAVARWAAEHGDYIKTGEQPVMTERKQMMIDASEADELRWIKDYCAARIEDGEDFAISTAQALAFAKRNYGRTLYTKKKTMGVGMAKVGMVQVVGAGGAEFALKFLNDKHRILLSPAAHADLARLALDGDALKDWLRKKLSATEHALRDGEPF